MAESPAVAQHRKLYEQWMQADPEWMEAVAGAWQRTYETVDAIRDEVDALLWDLLAGAGAPAWSGPAAESFRAVMTDLQHTSAKAAKVCAENKAALRDAAVARETTEVTPPYDRNEWVQAGAGVVPGIGLLGGLAADRYFDYREREELQKAQQQMAKLSGDYTAAQDRFGKTPEYRGPKQAESYGEDGPWDLGPPVDGGGSKGASAADAMAARGGSTPLAHGGGHTSAATFAGANGSGDTTLAGAGGVLGGPTGAGGGASLPAGPGAGAGLPGGGSASGGVVGGGVGGLPGGPGGVRAARGGLGKLPGGPLGGAGGRLPGGSAGSLPGGRVGAGRTAGRGGPGGRLGGEPEGGARPGASGAGRGGVGRSGAAPLGMGAGSAGGTDKERRRRGWLREGEDIWGSRDQEVAPPVLGEDPTRRKDDEDEW